METPKPKPTLAEIAAAIERDEVVNRLWAIHESPGGWYYLAHIRFPVESWVVGCIEFDLKNKVLIDGYEAEVREYYKNLF